MKHTNKLKLVCAMLLLGLGLSSPVLAAERGTKEEAKALVEKAGLS